MKVRSWVYFIQEIDHDGTPGHIKIGKANDPDGRCSTFQTGNSRDLRILHCEPGGLPRETALHDRFRRYQLRRRGRKTEWFRPGPDLMAYLAEAPKYRRGPEPAWWKRLGRWLAATVASLPVGGWRIIAGAAGRRRYRKSAWIGGAGTVGAGTAWATLDPAIVVPAVAGVALVTLAAAGRT